MVYIQRKEVFSISHCEGGMIEGYLWLFDEERRKRDYYHVPNL